MKVANLRIGFVYAIVGIERLCGSMKGGILDEGIDEGMFVMIGWYI